MGGLELEDGKRWGGEAGRKMKREDWRARFIRPTSAACSVYGSALGYSRVSDVDPHRDTWS